MKSSIRYNFKKRMSSVIFSALFLFSFVCPMLVKAEETNQGVSDREILLLSLLSYKTEFKEDVSEMGDDTKFNEKWFGDYASTSELKGWKTVNHEVNSDDSNKFGFCAATFKKDDNIVVTFKGIDNARFFENWKYMIPNQEHPRDKYVTEYINDLKYAKYINENSKIYIGGYSLGGHLAIYATGVLLSIENIKDKFQKTVTFNGIGIGHVEPEHEIIRYNLSKLSDKQLVHYRICGDIASTIGDYFTKPITLKFIPIKRKFFSLLYWTHGPHLSHHFLAQEPFLVNNDKSA